MDDNNEPKKARRVRYNGTHPKTFKEKYKELQPESYTADVEKVMAQGRTPAGMHRSICVNEILTFLNILPGQIGLDATLGYGGHSAAMIKCLIPGGKLYALDVDSIEMPKTKERLLKMGFGEDVVDIRKMNFASADLIVYEAGPMDFVLADLGVSSMQIDNPERGFSFKIEGPLDLRLNPSNGKSAAMLLKTITEKELEEILITNADEPNARLIAKAIIDYKTKNEPIETTTTLKQLIKETLPKKASEDDIKKTCQRCFQALRIAVNDEFKVLDKFLEKLPFILKPGGRVVILSFHSGEDRRVKKSFQNFERQGVYSSISPDIIRPSVEECAANPRAKSTKMRWAVRG